MVAVHGGIDEDGGELRLPRKLLPGGELALGRDRVGLGEAAAAVLVGLGDGHEAQSFGVAKGVSAVYEVASVACADHDGIDWLGHRSPLRCAAGSIARFLAPRPGHTEMWRMHAWTSPVIPSAARNERSRGISVRGIAGRDPSAPLVPRFGRDDPGKWQGH